MEIHDRLHLLFLSPTILLVLVLDVVYCEPTDLESACVVTTAGQGCRKSDPESALRRFDIQELTR